MVFVLKVNKKFKSNLPGDGKVVGMAMATPAAAGWHSAIHPLYADSLDIAKLMFRYLFENQPMMSEGVRFETIVPNEQNAKELMSAVGINETVSKMTRQYTGKEITTTLHKIYSLSNCELHFF